MSLYNVAELFVSRDFQRGSTTIWEADAKDHKAKLCWVDSDCDVGRRFCRGGGVGALLRRPVDQEELEMLLDSEVESLVGRDVNAVPAKPTRHKKESCIVQSNS